MCDMLFDIEIEAPPPPKTHTARSFAALFVDSHPPATSSTTTTTAKPKKTAAAPRETINKWPGIEEIAKGSGVASVTCVDPGTRNLALMRMEFLPVLRITHTHVIDLDLLCRGLEEADPKMRLRTNRGESTNEPANYPMEAYLFALRRYVAAEGRRGSGGCFDSDMCLVEEQSFDRLMSRVEATIVTAFEIVRGASIAVLAGAEGGTVSAAQLINAKSVKACYRPLFPLIADDESTVATSSARRKPFGVGDVRNTGNEKQRLLHKKMAIKYGSLLIPAAQFAHVVPPQNFTEHDKQRLAQRKMDDLYDTLFMCCYFVSTFMFHFYKCRKRGYSRPLPAFETPPQRPYANYEEIVEVAAAVGTEPSALKQLLDALTK